MEQGTKSNTITINLPDVQKVLSLKAVLAYEAGMRGLSMSQTLVDMVFASADVASYPDDVRAELEELEARRASRAARRSVDVAARLARSA